MLLVNLIGEPGAGKSTMAAGLFHALKAQGYNAELITEFTKELILTEDRWTLSDELIVFAEKYRRVRRLERVDIVITDSPLINSIVYGDSQFGPSGGAFFEAVARRFDNVYFAIKRVAPYVPYGRMPDENAAAKAGEEIIAHLNRITKDWSWVDGSDEGLPQLVDAVKLAAQKRDIQPFVPSNKS
jgi:ABC-type oligopeptide transport system ATPase subunit